MMSYNFAEPPTEYVRDCRAADPSILESTLAEVLEDPAALEPDSVLEDYLPAGTVCSDPEQGEGKLYIFDERPDPAAGPPLAAALHFFGGGWKGGHPSVFFPSCRHLARQGCVAISVGYRHYQPDTEGGLTSFDCVADCREALRYVRAHSAELNIDPTRCLAIGDSAGGHLSLMIGFPSAGDLADWPTDWRPGRPGDLAGVADAVVSFNPVADFETCHYAIQHVFGPDRLSISPVHRLREHGLARGNEGLPHPPTPYPPTLLMHGELDTVCLVDQSRLFSQIGAEHGLPIEYVELAGVQHAFCYPNYTAKLQTVAETMEETLRFMAQQGYLGSSAREGPAVAAVTAKL